MGKATQDVMERAIERIAALAGDNSAAFYRPQLERVARMSGAAALFRHLHQSVDLPSLDDHRTQAHYALAFAGLGFEVEIEPLGPKGPDLAVVRDETPAVVEVRRFRPKRPGPPKIDSTDPDATLRPYGDWEAEVTEVLDALVEKTPQLGGQPGIIALWGSGDDADELGAREAMRLRLVQVEAGDRPLPPNLLFLVFASQWVRGGPGPRQFYGFPCRGLERPYETWVTDLQRHSFAFLRAVAIRPVVRSDRGPGR